MIIKFWKGQGEPRVIVFNVHAIWAHSGRAALYVRADRVNLRFFFVGYDGRTMQYLFEARG